MIYQHWKGKLSVTAKSFFGTARGKEIPVEQWIPCIPSGATTPIETNPVTTELFPNAIRVGGGLTKVRASLTFTGTVEYVAERHE